MKLALIAFLVTFVVQAEVVNHGISPISSRPIVIVATPQNIYDIPSFYRLPSLGPSSNFYNPSVIGFGQPSYQMNPFLNQFSVDSRIPFWGSGTIANSGLFGYPGIGTYSGNYFSGLNPYWFNNTDFSNFGNYSDLINPYDYSNLTGYYPDLTGYSYPDLTSYGIYDPFYSNYWSLMNPTYFDYPSYYWSWWNDLTDYSPYLYSPSTYGYWDNPYSYSWGFDTTGGMVDWYTPWSTGYVNW